VIDAALTVHRVLGPGFFERVYHNALVVELCARAISFQAHHRITLTYRDVVVGEGELDLLGADRLVVELKAVEALAQVHRSQVLSYRLHFARTKRSRKRQAATAPRRHFMG